MGRRWHFMGFAVLAGALGTLIACATAPITGRSQIMLLNPQEEAALGIQAYQQSYSPMIQQALGIGLQVGFLLPMSRTQESEADRIGLILMAIAGYNPNAAIGLWERMRTASGGKGGPEFLRTHPTETTRIADIQTHLPEAMKYYKGR